MEVQWFLEERTTFLRYYYDKAASQFLEVLRKIDAKEAPYNDDVHDDSDEPLYLEEWSTAADGLELLGRSCVSTLSATYKQRWQSVPLNRL
jgi:hypothetical protein